MILQKFEDNSKFGYLDDNKKIIIPAKYEDAKEFKNNLAIVKNNGLYGLINSSDEVIIDFNFVEIKEHLSFYECIPFSKTKEKKLSYWYNQKGLLIHKDKAIAMSETFLCISNGEKYGVISSEGFKIINCLYDEIIQKGNLFIVLKSDKLGLYDLKGKIILDAVYSSIESVVIENNPLILGSIKKNSSQTCTFQRNCYRSYCKEFFFDSESLKKKDKLYREIITSRIKDYIYNFEKKHTVPIYSIYNWRPINDITKPMILSLETCKILFRESEGIVPNSEFDDIEQITHLCYVVKRKGLYGVYRIDTKELIVPIEYNSIRFYGGHTVFVCKDDLWGAKSLILSSNEHYEKLKVCIPAKYYEITFLDDFQKYFCCKKKKTYSDRFYYSIVNQIDECVYDIENMECDSQFVFYDRNHILSSQYSKYGFISIDGYKSIPFKYDEIIERKDGKFNVRINNRWGIINLEGRELTPIKYKKNLPTKIEKWEFVNDAETECYGIIDNNGFEQIPTIYEHLMKSESENIFYFGYGGYPDDYCENFFSGNINQAIWGVINNRGNTIIEAKYDCFRIYKEFILAGRDGGFVPEDDNGSKVYCPNYGGEFDLFNMNGELLFGGFSEFLFDKINELFIFFWGGNWKEYPGYDDDWNNIHTSTYKYERGNDLWLILDKDFKTILRDKKGIAKKFRKGFIGKIEIKKENNKITHLYNMPIEYMAKGFSHVGINSIIINDSNSDIHKSQAVDIKTGKKTKMYSKIEQITDLLFFFAEEKEVGITNINSENVIENCLFITYPVGDFIFITKKKDNDKYEVLLYKMDNLKEPLAIAINEISIDSLVFLVKRNGLKIELDKKIPELKSIMLSNERYFNEDFKKMVTLSDNSQNKSSNYRQEFDYLFSNDYHFLPKEPNYSEEDGEDYDYMQDTWDAMTDGMYGDMPEGFSGDFDFLGR